MNELEQRIRQRVAMTIGMQADQAIARATERAISGVRPAQPEAMPPADELSVSLPESLVLAAAAQVPRERTHRPGALAGSWRNAYLATAMPVLLLIERTRHSGPGLATDRRGQLALEVKAFREKLTAAGKPATDIERASSLLCTYADEVASDIHRRQSGTVVEGATPRSLLVDFHGDAWGGEGCFADLEGYRREPDKHADLLDLYAWVLTLGLEGRFRMMDQGHVLLDNLRASLRATLHRDTESSLAVVAPAGIARPRPRLSPLRLLFAGLVLCAFAYAVATWHLREHGLPVRQAILSWEPPARPVRIDIQETLPPELAALLAEGWLEAIRQPYGWLLLFTSDNAFASARAELNAEYIHNISRLGRVLAHWPGDLEVVGHTDAQPLRPGRFKDNEALSVARAESVQRILNEAANVRQPDRSVTAIGVGDAQPIADDTTDAGRRRNRRVDIRWKITAPAR
jgi:type VI secretion system protein ImpK